jgi:hypothetical protein
MKTVRELTVAGPCITLGVLLRETASRISYRDCYGTSKFISKRWAVHTEPCPSCPDYPKADYEDETAHLLRARAEGPRSRAAEQRDELPPSQMIEPHCRHQFEDRDASYSKWRIAVRRW